MPVNISMDWAPESVTGFVTRAEQFLLARGPDALLLLERDFTAMFSRRATITAIVNQYLQRIVDGVLEDSALIGKDSLMLRYAPHMVLRVIKDRADVSAFSAQPSSYQVTNYPSNTLVLFITPEPVEVDWYCLEPGASFDRFDASLQIKHESRQLCQPMSCIYVDAAQRFPVFPPSEGNIYVVLSAAPACTQIVSFEEGTLRPLGASMSSEVTSIICVMLELIRERGNAAAIDAIRELVAHQDHHVRWAATTALGKFDRCGALDVVRKLAADDPHKFIRDAARRTLEMAAGATS
ncbi:MAG TPA: HEAT repeat domain-containing protein [Telluria sp.]